MGIDKERIIYVEKPMQFNSVTVPYQSRLTLTFTKEFLTPYQAIKSRVMPGKKKKIYLTRRELDIVRNPAEKLVRCFNEKYFEDFFAAHGFEVVSPEKLPIEEQISLVMGADEIATTVGTLAHWIVFCKPSAKFIMLNRTSNYVSGSQCQLIEALNFNNYYIVDGSHNFMSGDHTLGVNMLGPNKCWKEFVLDYFNEWIELDCYDTMEESLDEYVDFWCERYSAPEKLDIVRSLKDMCRRIITLEKNCMENHPLLTYQTYVSMKGWGDGCWKSENQISNPLDEKLGIQAVKINFPGHKVYYSVYYNDTEGWSAEVSAREMAGTTGKAKSIYGIRIRLDEDGAREFDILYRVHKFDDTWTSWAKNGEELVSKDVKLNALQIKLEPTRIRFDESWLNNNDEIYLQGQRQSLI